MDVASSLFSALIKYLFSIPQISLFHSGYFHRKFVLFGIY